MTLKQTVCDKLVMKGAVFNTDERCWCIDKAQIKELKNISEIKEITKSEMSLGYVLILQDNSRIIVKGVGEYKKDRKESYIVSYRFNRYITAKLTCRTWKEAKKEISNIKKSYKTNYIRVFTDSNVEVAKSLWRVEK